MNIRDKIFPTPLSVTALGGAVRLTGVRAEKEAQFALASFLKAAEGSGLSACDTGNVCLKWDESIGNAEGYAMDAEGDGVTVRAKSLGGFVYAAGTLSQLAEGGFMPAMRLYDEPLCKVRGVHMYLPPSDVIDEFLRVMDLLARLKYNTVFLEIGGGVEYESHPEINKAWKRFCREARDYYGGPQGLQASEAHWKDSTHVELAGGHCLKKSELAEIVSYIRSLGMEVIPEIQALSHAYYLTLAHPEIAEQTFEPYPDTWCPMNEASYRLYEDIARELHELIGFTKVSIGHDEIRILGKCPRCKGKSGAELVAHDLNRLHDIWEKMGVKMFMWGESLQNYINAYGNRAGGKILRGGRFGRTWEMPATYEAIDMIPTDITMLDWQWGQSIYSTSEFSERGISFLYGNFHGPSITHWQTLVKNKGFLGAEVSTWCVTDFNELSRNGWFYDFVFSSFVLWEQDYDDDKRAAYALRANDLMPSVRAFLHGGAAADYLGKAFFSAKGETLAIAPVENSERSALLCERFPGGLLGKTAVDVTVAVDKEAGDITVLHAADFGEGKPPAREQTWYFHDRTPLLLGYYSVTYEDGLVYSYPMEYGYHIGDKMLDFAPLPQAFPVKSAEDESGVEKKGKLIQPAAVCGFKDAWFKGTVATCDAYPVNTKDGVRTVFATTLKNRRPGVKIKDVKFFYPLNNESKEIPHCGEIVFYGVLA